MKKYKDFIIEKQIDDIINSSNEAIFGYDKIYNKVKEYIGNMIKEFPNPLPYLKRLWEKTKFNKKVSFVVISLLLLNFGFTGSQLIENFGQSQELVQLIEDIESEKSNSEEHQVVKGETLYSISKKYGVSPKDIIYKNELKSKTIKSGQILSIPNQEDIKLYQGLEEPVEILESPKAQLVDGMFDHSKIVNKRINRLEIAPMKEVNAIILHRTATDNLKGTLKGFKSRRVGTHFLVDYDGTIYQTASLNYLTAHILYIRPRCKDGGNCSLEDEKVFKKIGFNTKSIHLHEIKKKYPERYPVNKDAVGIEVMGAYDDKSEKWENLTPEQIKSVKFLVGLLKGSFSLTDDDVYTHEEISYKTAGEGSTVLKAISESIKDLGTELWKEIPMSSWNNIGPLLLIEEHEIKTMNLINDIISPYERTKISKYANCITLNIYYDKIYSLYLIISKDSDDYYYVIEYIFKWGNTIKESTYIADQLDGLEELLKNILKSNSIYKNNI